MSSWKKQPDCRVPSCRNGVECCVGCKVKQTDRSTALGIRLRARLDHWYGMGYEYPCDRLEMRKNATAAGAMD